MSTSNPHFNCLNYDPQPPGTEMELNFSLAAENGWLSCNRGLNFFFFFLSSTTYEEGNEAKLKKIFFFNPADEELSTSLVKWHSLVKSVK